MQVAPWTIEYEYDSAGNRTQKTNHAAGRVACYTYDVDDSGVTYGTANNRLEFYVEYVGEATDCDVPGSAVVLGTKYYFYTDAGNVSRVVTKPETPGPGDPELTAVRFDYASNGEAVAYVVGEQWDENASGNAENYDVSFVREFRYDSGRQRYLDRPLDPALFMIARPDQGYGNPPGQSDTWSDYSPAPGGFGDPDAVYGDFTITGPPGQWTMTDVRSFEPGLASFGWTDNGTGTQVPDAASVAYVHTNHLGTTRLTSDAASPPQAQGAVVYTAFGERICAV
ncbi:MAG: hypothetical protein ACE5E5_16000, partial [Phycisphaerae bacterium]